VSIRADDDVFWRRISGEDARSVEAAGTFKDVLLDRLRHSANVAQYASFDPQLRSRYSLVRGYEPNRLFVDPAEAARALLATTAERSVNVRSYDPRSSKGREFIYGLKTVEQVREAVDRLASSGLHTIINETVDIRDGGVSGVAHGRLIEFAPEDTPRCVELPGALAVERSMGLKLLRAVYGFAPELDYPSDMRVEFSVHPIRRGYREGHTIVWETELLPEPAGGAVACWPNRFSRFVGDKAFGLLMGSLLGHLVPATLVIPRKLAPFRFGVPTGTGETWIRTCPVEWTPGKYSTQRGWTDPFRLMNAEDPEDTAREGAASADKQGSFGIASILSQEGVPAVYSGAAEMMESGEPRIEGVEGFGDRFMLGDAAPQQIPASVLKRVHSLCDSLSSSLGGAFRMEWVCDGTSVWLVQLNLLRIPVSETVVFPGEPPLFRRFNVTSGLPALRALAREAKASGEGIVLVGRIGWTSHMCDLLRQAEIPSRLSNS
jgi:hypothetical protein